MKKRIFKKAAAVVVSLAVGFMTVSCGAAGPSLFDGIGRADGGDGSGGNTGAAQQVATKGFSMALSENGDLSVTRLQRANKASMGAPGTWTIFVYLCGSDLETGGGLASGDIDEMISGSSLSNVRYIVTTGGSDGWENDMVDASRLDRFCIENGNMQKVDSAEWSGMNDPQTLYDFLSWGVANYPADKMGVILWDHGGGSISGVCFDEKNYYDSLTLPMLDRALASLYPQMTDNFEFFGFDACLMGTVEAANVLASYADYMYASQEVEPGYGWDYIAMAELLNSNPNADGLAMGRVVSDSFYDMCESIGAESRATFSIIDLSKMDNLIQTFNDYSLNLYNATGGDTGDTTNLTSVAREMVYCENFGGNTSAEGYTNMVDLAAVVSAGSGFVPSADNALSAISDAVAYMKNGSDHSGACGLSTYYPLQIQGSNELSTFGETAISPYYLAFVDRAAYVQTEGDISGYDNQGLLNGWQDYQGSGSNGSGSNGSGSNGSGSNGSGSNGSGSNGSGSNGSGSNGSGSNGSGSGNAITNYFGGYNDEAFQVTGHSPFVDFAVEPTMNEEGDYYFVLTPESAGYVESVEGMVLWISPDGQDAVTAGSTAKIGIDWESGTFWDDFDGRWFSLPDGQNLSVEIQSQNNGYDVYASHVLVNDEETNLIIVHDYTEGRAYIAGVWAGIDENGAAAREMTQLAPGDVIVPCAKGFSLSTLEEVPYAGEGYVYNGNPDIIFDTMPDAMYFFCFNINDIFGDYYQTDVVNFTISDGSISFQSF